MTDRLTAMLKKHLKKEEKPKYSDANVYFVTDATTSMADVIGTVVSGMERICDELLENPDRGDIQIAIRAVYDHGPWLLGDYGLYDWNDPTQDRQALQKHIRRIGDVFNWHSFWNTDNAEAYECAWLKLAQELGTRDQDRKNVVIFAGDMVPHGMLEDQGYELNWLSFCEIKGPTNSVHVDDRGCSHDVDYKKAWELMTLRADVTVFVGCSEHEASPYRGCGVDALQRSLIRPDSSQIYIPLTEIGDVPNIVMGATRLAQSDAALDEYIERLELADPQGANRIRGYLTQRD